MFADIFPAEASQFQCDEGAAPVTGFSIDSKDTIAYAGSSAFYACPATDTEYNIYTQPVKDQAKCTIVSYTSEYHSNHPSLEQACLMKQMFLYLYFANLFFGRDIV